MALWTKAITCDKAGFKSRFCQEHQAGKNIISVNPVILSNFSSCSSYLRGKKIREISVNPRLMNYLCAYKAPVICRLSSVVYRLSSTTVESALQNHLFMQNEPNFRKSQMKVNKVLAKDYEKKTLGEHGKNEPKTNPIYHGVASGEAGSKPIAFEAVDVFCAGYIICPIIVLFTKWVAAERGVWCIIWAGRTAFGFFSLI